jgi:hypothetical protein
VCFQAVFLDLAGDPNFDPLFSSILSKTKMSGFEAQNHVKPIKQGKDVGKDQG